MFVLRDGEDPEGYGKLVAHKRRHDTRKHFRGAGIDVENARMRMGAPLDLAEEHSRKR